MKSYYKLSIPEPCHEDWETMTPNEKGKFCKSCSKTVVDFTKMNTEAIQDYISKHKNQRICGHIKQTQLDTIKIKVPETIFNQHLNFQKLFLLALLLAMGTSILSCKDETGQLKKIESIEVSSAIIDSVPTKKHTEKDSIIKVDTIKTQILKKPKPLQLTPQPPIFDIMGDIVIVDGLIELDEEKPLYFKTVQQPPRFPDTPKHLSKDEEQSYFQNKISEIIIKNFKTTKADDIGVYGLQKIYTQFEIDDLGNIDKLQIRTPHPRLDDEVKRVIKLLPKFIPARHEGKNVAIEYTLPITFKVSE